MQRKENRNPNNRPKMTMKPTVSHSTTPDCSSRDGKNSYIPKYIKKANTGTIKEEMHSQTYSNSPNSLMQSINNMEALPCRIKERESTGQLERQLNDRTEKFNCSIRAFHHILTGVNKIICDETVRERDRLAIANKRINELLNAFEEFSLGQE